jgi:hypothetical protein
MDIRIARIAQDLGGSVNGQRAEQLSAISFSC